MENLLYEIRPFLYVSGAMTGHALNSSAVMTVSSALLAFCAVTILYWRYQWRYQ